MTARVFLALCSAAAQLACSTAIAAGIDERPATALNVVIPVFDAGVPEDAAMHRDLGVFPRIREVEAKMLPFQLREALAASGEWGAVRVVAEPEPAAELSVYGTIRHSDGETLGLYIKAVDATGTVWLQQSFSGIATDVVDDTAAPDGRSPYAVLLAEVGRALRVARERFDEADLRRIAGLSLVRYGIELIPETFGQYAEQGADGTWNLLRLPAWNDPMLRRIELIRNTEFLITDTVDIRYRELNEQLVRTYRHWREYRQKYLAYEAENERFAEANTDDAPRGTWEAIKDQYDIYKYDRITVQERDRLAIAFSNEVTPALNAMEERIAELDDWVEDGYREWRRILDELYDVELEMRQQVPQ